MGTVGFQMPASIPAQSATLDNDVQPEQKREFDRWRVAVDIVRRLREAGMSCELTDVQIRH